MCICEVGFNGGKIIDQTINDSRSSVNIKLCFEFQCSWSWLQAEIYFSLNWNVENWWLNWIVKCKTYRKS